MSSAENFAAIFGLTMRSKNPNRSSVVTALRKRGIVVSPATISRITGGDTSGEKTVRRIAAANLLESNKTGTKDQFYLSIAQTGQGLNMFQLASRPYRLSCTNFIQSIAEILGITNVQGLRRCLRAMRVDLVLTELDNPLFDPSVFEETAEKYFAAYVNGHNTSPSIAELSKEYKGGTIEGFYRSYYELVTNPITLRTWPPYEVNVMADFYKWRISQESPLSQYDKIVLISDIQNIPEGEIEDRIREISGVRYDASVTYNHLNVLLNGKP